MLEKYLYIRTGLVSARSEEMENIRALDWCPGLVVFPL